MVLYDVSAVSFLEAAMTGKPLSRVNALNPSSLNCGCY